MRLCDVCVTETVAVFITGNSNENDKCNGIGHATQTPHKRKNSKLFRIFFSYMALK